MTDASIRLGRVRLDLTVLVACILIELLLLAMLPYLATTDGPIHIGSGAALRDYLLDPSGIHREYLGVNWFPVPYLTPELLMAALLTFLDPGTAEKVYVAGYVAGLPLALYYAIGGVRPDRRWLALVAIPVTFNASLHFGFYNFCYGLVTFLIVIGYLLRHRDLGSGRTTIIFGSLLFGVYLTHIVPFVEAVMASFLIVAMEGLEAPLVRRATLVGAARRLRPWVVAAAPSLILALIFFVQGGTHGSDYRRAFLTLALGLPSLAWPIVSYDRWESALTLLTGAALAVATLAAIVGRWRTRTVIRAGDWAIVFVLVSTLAYFAAPEALGHGGVVSQRLALFPILGLVLWLAAQTLDRRWIGVVSVSALVTAVALLVMRAPSYVLTSDAVADYVAVARCMVPRSTMVQANLWWLRSGPLGRISPLIHDAGRLAATTHGHDLGSITGEVPIFPLQNRAENDPFRYLVTRPQGEYEVPPGIDPLGYESMTNGSVDYVVLFGRDHATPETLASPDWLRLDAQLASGYRRVAVSQTGVVELFERSRPDLAAEGDALRAAGGGACLSP